MARIKPHLTTIVVGVITAVIAAVILTIVLSGDDGKPHVVVTTPAATRRPTVDECKQAVPKELSTLGGDEDYALGVCRNSMWTRTPDLLLDSFIRDADDAFLRVATEDDLLAGQVLALSVDKAVTDAADYDGDPVYLVGRVARSAILATDEFGEPEREVRLNGRDRTYAVVVDTRDINAELHRGQIVVVQGFLLARGVARFVGSVRDVDAAYFTTYSIEAPEDFDSKTIRARVRALKR